MAFYRIKLAELHRLFLKSSLIQTVGIVAVTLLGIQLARFLGPARYGIYGLILSAVSILSVAAQFGLPLLAIRTASSTKAAAVGQPAVVRWFLWRAAIISVGVAAIALMTIHLLFGTSDISLSDQLVASAIIVMFSLVATMIGLLRGSGENLTGQAIETVARPAAISLIVLVIYLSTASLTVTQVLVAQLVVAVAALLAALFFMKPHLRSASATTGQFLQPGWASVSLSFAASALLIAANGNYPMIVSGFYVGADDLGILRVALSSAMLLALPATIANIAIAPVIARLKDGGSESEVRRTVAETTILTFGATFFALVVFALVGRALIAFLFGPEYVAAYGPLLILGVAQLIVSAFGTTATYLNMIGHERVVIKAFTVAVPVGIIAGVGLVRSHGIMGAAFSNIIMVSVWHLYVVLWNRASLNAPISILAALSHWQSHRSLRMKDGM